jgi:hypothetical protein
LDTVAERRQFPSDIARQLLGIDYRLLDELSYLAKQQRQRTGASYAMPGRAYLSSKLGVSIRTISRSVARLKRLGILEAFQRRPVRGQWKTNLYKIRSWLGWRLGQLSSGLRKITHRGPRRAHIASEEQKIKTSGAPLRLPQRILEKIPLLETWMTRGS